MYHNIDASEVKATLKTMIRLLESNWKFDIYSQAADDFNVKKWNKSTGTTCTRFKTVKGAVDYSSEFHKIKTRQK